MKKKNTAKKTAINAQKISEALKEGTQKSLQDMLNEAISNTLMEAEKDEEDPKDSEEEDVENAEDEDGYDVEDVDTEDAADNEDDEDNAECEDGECDVDDEDEDDWSDMEDYKVGDDAYDFTGVDGDDVLKVFNKLSDDDKIFVKGDEDGDYDVDDEETGADYVIELGDDADLSDEDDIDEDEGIDVDLELDGDGELGDEDLDGDAETEFEIDADDDTDDEDLDDDAEAEFEIDADDEDLDDDDETEIEIEDGDDDEVDVDLGDEDDDDLLNEEDLGYTTTYAKDVMPGLNMNEPADSKTTNDWDDGAPKGNKRPYSGYENKKSNLFTNKVNEGVDECGSFGGNGEIEENNTGKAAHRTTKKGFGKLNNQDVKRHHSEDGEFKSLSESVRLYNAAKKIQAENKQYKTAIDSIKKSLYEAAVLNVTLGQVVKLLAENTTSRDEKKAIVEQFGKVKTIQESKALYESFTRQLNESNKRGGFILDKSYGNKQSLNETTLYQNNPAISMMSRMDALDKMWKENK